MYKALGSIPRIGREKKAKKEKKTQWFIVILHCSVASVYKTMLLSIAINSSLHDFTCPFSYPETQKASSGSVNSRSLGSSEDPVSGLSLTPSKALKISFVIPIFEGPCITKPPGDQRAQVEDAGDQKAMVKVVFRQHVLEK